MNINGKTTKSLGKAARLAVAAGLAISAFGNVAHAGDVDPVLMVISNQDFWYQDYADTRSSLEAQGLEVVVAAATTETATPHASRDSYVQPDIALTDVEAEDYSAIVFSGGWGMAQYQYGFEGTYHNAAYNDRETKWVVNDLINDFVDQDKTLAAICHGVSVLAWARVDGESLLEGKRVTGWAGSLPGFELDGFKYEDAEAPAHYFPGFTGGVYVASASVGDPMSSHDDVIVDGNIITAENFDAAILFAAKVAAKLRDTSR